jgi:hypothetical protein
MFIKDRMKMQWFLVAVNVFAALLNVTLAVGNLVTGHWVGLANLIAAAFSAWVAWGLYVKIPEIRADEQLKIIRILRGHFG